MRTASASREQEWIEVSPVAFDEVIGIGAVVEKVLIKATGRVDDGAAKRT